MGLLFASAFVGGSKSVAACIGPTQLEVCHAAETLLDLVHANVPMGLLMAAKNNAIMTK